MYDRRGRAVGQGVRPAGHARRRADAGVHPRGAAATVWGLSDVRAHPDARQPRLPAAAQAVRRRRRQAGDQRVGRRLPADDADARGEPRSDERRGPTPAERRRALPAARCRAGRPARAALAREATRRGAVREQRRGARGRRRRAAARRGHVHRARRAAARRCSPSRPARCSRSRRGSRRPPTSPAPANPTENRREQP